MTSSTLLPFLFWGGALTAYGACAALALRWRTGAVAAAFDDATEAELEPVEFAALISREHATTVAVTELALKDAVDVDGRSVRRRTAAVTDHLHPFTRQVLVHTPRSAAVDLSTVTRSFSRAWWQLAEGLAERGYLVRSSGVPRLVAVMAVAVVGVVLAAVGGFGDLQIPTVIRGGFWLVAGVLVAGATARAVALLRGGVRRYRRTARADRLIAEWGDRYAYLDPAERPSMRTYGPRETAIAVALFGTNALEHIDAGRLVEIGAARRPGGFPARRQTAALGIGLLAGRQVGSCASCSGAYGAWTDGGFGGWGLGGAHAGGHDGSPYGGVGSSEPAGSYGGGGGES